MRYKRSAFIFRFIVALLIASTSMQPPTSSPTAGNGFDGTRVVPNSNSSVTTPSLASSPTQLLSFILRFTALTTTFIATIVMGVNKETETFVLNGNVVEFTIKTTSSDASQLEYFIAVNAIAFVYSSASLGMSILNRMNNSRSGNFTLVITVLDLVMVALLFSGMGSASAIGVLARNGAGNLWLKFCDVFGKYCGNMAAAIVMSMFGALAFFALVLLSHVGLYNK